MKIFKHRLCDLIDELEDENGTGHVWIYSAFYDERDPSTWFKATINSPINYIVAKPYDAQNKFWLKCILLLTSVDVQPGLSQGTRSGSGSVSE